tara:strand:+ start:648 stop:1193 length:546 start_codon:yes stop_codon:yes gene_type:complete
MKKYDPLATIKKRKKIKTKYNPKGIKASEGQEKAYKLLWGAMNASIAAIQLGEALKNTKIYNDETYRKICTAFALGAVDCFGQLNRLREEEIIELVLSFIQSRYKEFSKEEQDHLFDWLIKNYVQKDVLEVKQAGGDFALQFYKVDVKRPIALFGAIFKHKNKYVFKENFKSKKKKLFGIF